MQFTEPLDVLVVSAAQVAPAAHPVVEVQDTNDLSARDNVIRNDHLVPFDVLPRDVDCHIVNITGKHFARAKFCGEDGEGFELQRALRGCAGVRLDLFVHSPGRRTFTYCKPLLMYQGRPPEELNRLDSKNWSPTPAPVQELLIDRITQLASSIDAMSTIVARVV